MKTFLRVFLVLVSVVVMLLLIGGGTAAYFARANEPKTNGNIQAPGLNAQVTVYRDNYGIPTIVASNSHDLFFAQGFVQAQDRFWQMEFWRRVGSGRLSEVFGTSTLGQDLFIRSQGWRRVSDAEFALLPANEQAVLTSFAEGVNAYLAINPKPALEFTVLGLIGTNYTPEPWTPGDSLAWAKVMAYDLGGNASTEVQRLRVYQLLGEAAVGTLYPPYDYENFPVVVPDAAAIQAYDTLDLSALLAYDQALRDLRGGSVDEGLGSNNWVVSGALTDTGMPYLVNDPHLGIQMPSIWYEVGLICEPVGPDCPYHLRGFAFSAAPGVIIGHNQHIAWGLTNVGPDVQDYYIERLNPDDPTQYEVNGEWVQAEVVTELVQVRGEIDADGAHGLEFSYDPNTNFSTVVMPVVITRHGPIMNFGDSGTRDLEGDSPLGAVPENYGLALKWTALEPGTVLSAYLGVNLARNFDEFRESLALYTAPSQNFVYADVEGNIGYVMPGWIPIRQPNHSGLFPVPGWTDEYEWLGLIPTEELPYSYNPPIGYIYTANNAVVGPDYPYVISYEWDFGYRAERIRQMLEEFSADGVTRDDMMAMHGDSTFLSAMALIPILADLNVSATAQPAHDLLMGWDFVSSTDSAGAALYHTFWGHLVIQTFGDELPPNLLPGVNARAMYIFEVLSQDPTHVFWDDITTPDVVETRDDIYVRAFEMAVAELSERLGSDPTGWQYGQLHTADFRHATLGESGVGPIEAIFNREGIAVSGGSAHVNANNWSRLGSFFSSGQLDLRVTSLPSLRMIVDLQDLDNSIGMHTTGQSGHPFSPHYDDFIGPWSRVEYHPLQSSLAVVRDNAVATLTLTP